MKRQRKTRRTVSALLLFSLVLGGCGSAGGEEAPELMEPLSVNTSCRPTEYGDVGDLDVLIGTVVPTDYCFSYETNVTVRKLTVEVGDSVKKGEVVARADTDAAKEELEDLKGQLAEENETYEINRQIGVLEQKQLEKQKREAEKAAEDDGGDGEGEDIGTETEEEGEEEETGTGEAAGAEETSGADYDTQIGVLKENARYDKLLHEYRVGKLKESIAAQEGIIADGKLKASHAGRVTYVKDLSAAKEASGGEVVVIVSDEEDPYIELDNMTVNMYGNYYEKCAYKYIMSGGERLPVTELNYSSDELILAKAADSYPNVRLRCEGAGNLTLGENYLVYYQNGVRDVLVVDNDAVMEDGDGNFVYVKNGNGAREKRPVTLGERDENYSEVVEGLAEGELVYCELKERMPSDYGTQTVALSDFSVTNATETFLRSGSAALTCTSEYEGIVKEIAVEEGQKVKRGELLCVVYTGDGGAAIREAQLAIEREQESYRETVKSYDEQLAEIPAEDQYGRKILSLEKKLAALSHASALESLQESLAAVRENNDGKGNRSVYAQSGGTVEEILTEEGAQVQPGDALFTVSGKAGDLILLQLVETTGIKCDTQSPADIGEEVFITVNKKTYTGVCVGRGNTAGGKAYLASDKKGARLSFCGGSVYEDPTFCVDMGDTFHEEVGELESGVFSFASLQVKQVCAVPSSMVFTSQETGGAGRKYVWRLEDGEVFKQYVRIDDEGRLTDGNCTVILSGLRAGDVIVAE